MNESLIPLHKIGSKIIISTEQGDANAFVPHPLPEEIELSTTTVNLLSKADQSIGKLSAASERLPNPDLILMSYIGQEALSSSKIEGTITSLSEVFAAQALSIKYEAGVENENVAQVRSYIEALYVGLAKIAQQANITHDLLRGVHKTLMTNPSGEAKSPGRYRQVQNYLLRGGRFRHIPPPVHLMEKAMDDLVGFANAANKLPDLIAIGLVHYQFETIHPFDDGNGRLGRMLILFQMISLGLLRYPVLPISTTIYGVRREYNNNLQGARNRGEYDLWLQFFLEAVTTAANKSLQQITDFENLGAKYRAELLDGITRATDVVDLLFRHPVLTASQLVEELSISRATAGRWIDILLEREVLGVLDTRQGQGKVKLYEVKEVFKILDSFDLTTEPSI